jgi:phospholipase/carboxylesterase
MLAITGGNGPHGGQSVAVSGTPLSEADSALILVHGRGGSATEILGLAQLLAPPGMACLAPQASGSTWYPYRFTEPVSRNEPYLSSALSVLGDQVEQLVRGGLGTERIALLGFSQGACLALEFASRQSIRFGAVIGLSGGLIGEAVSRPEVNAARPFEGMPLLLGCSEQDPHIPIQRVRETAEVMRAHGAEVTTRIYSGGDHGINQDEIEIARGMLARVAEFEGRPI